MIMSMDSEIISYILILIHHLKSSASKRYKGTKVVKKVYVWETSDVTSLWSAIKNDAYQDDHILDLVAVF